MNKAEKLLASLAMGKEGKKKEPVLDPELQEVWSRVSGLFPESSHVEIIVPDPDDSLAYTGGEFILPSEKYPKPAIVILPPDNSIYEKIKENRPLAIKIATDLLGKPFEEMSGGDIKKFIFLHEVGHAYDFVSNFESVDEIKEAGAVNVWDMLRDEEMKSLPVPDLDLNDLMILIGDIKEISEFIKLRPKLEPWLKELNIHTIRELLDAQEIAYRNLRKEHYADEFAARYFNL